MLLQGFAQDEMVKEVIIYGSVRSSGGKLPFVQIHITEDGKAFDKSTTPENANFAFNLHYDHEYILIFSKEGYFSKKLQVNTFNVPEEETDLGFEYRLNISLPKKVEGVDASVLNEPVGKIAFDKRYVNFEYNEKYMRQIQPKLFKLQSEINKILHEQELARKAEEERAAAELAAKKLAEQKYTQAVNKGDRAFHAGNYELAKEAYAQAAQLKPEEPYPEEMLKKTERQLKLRAEAEEKRKATEAKYHEMIVMADKAFDDKEYSVARSKYGEALRMKPDEKYPKAKITEIERIVNAMKAEAEKQRQNDEKYKLLIQQADQAFFIKEYRTAKNYYHSASQIKPEEPYPQQRIESIDALLAEELAAQVTDDKYGNLIRTADRAYNQKKYEKAMAAYQEASELKPAETYPKNQLHKIDKIFKDMAIASEREEQYRLMIGRANEAFDREEYEAAKKAYTKALEINPLAKHPKNRLAEIAAIIKEINDKKKMEAQYDNLITKADHAFSAEDFENARTLYQQASNIKPGESYPRDKINEVDQKIREMAGKRALKNKYRQFILLGDEELQHQQYEDALLAYQSAAGIFPEETYPKEQIDKIHSILQQRKTLLEEEKRYASLIARGDQNFELKKYTDAKTSYQGALSVKPAEPYPQRQIEIIDSALAAMAKKRAMREKRYNQLISTADSAFQQQNYSLSKSNYEQAILLKPKERYPRSRLIESRKLLYLASTGKPLKTEKQDAKIEQQDFENMEEFRNELAKNYPQGVTEEIVREKSRVITRRIVVEGNTGNEYKYIRYNWGGRYYFKNGKPITERSWTMETSR